MKPFRMIQVGTGGFGGTWCNRFLPPSVAEGLVQVVSAVDINPDALNNAKEHLGLSDGQCYTDLEKALDENPADFCTVVVPPAFHEQVVDAALEHDLHILSEKPIADTLEGSIRIANKLEKAGKKMGVTMSHRFDQDKTTLREMIRSGDYGDLDYLICRFTCDNRQYGSWGEFRHQIPDTLMVEGAVHQLDFLVDMAGAKCDTIYAQTWNPPWGQYQGDSQGLVTMTCENGKRVFYEGAKSNAMTLNCWGNDYVRAECEKATLILDRRKIEVFRHGVGPPEEYLRKDKGETVALAERPRWVHRWLIEQFVGWLNGGEPMVTNVEDSLQSVALIFGAIQSSRTGQPVKVQRLLEETRRRVESEDTADGPG